MFWFVFCTPNKKIIYIWYIFLYQMIFLLDSNNNNKKWDSIHFFFLNFFTDYWHMCYIPLICSLSQLRARTFSYLKKKWRRIYTMFGIHLNEIECCCWFIHSVKINKRIRILFEANTNEISQWAKNKYSSYK